MRPSTRHGWNTRRSIALGLTLLGAAGAVSCAGEETTEPTATMTDRAGVPEVSAIVVDNAAELAAALSPENAGRRILAHAGTYAIDAPLTVPDGATLVGEGVMQLDGAGLPAGFGAGPRTTLTMSADVPGNMLTLGNGATIRRLQIEDLAGRAGSVVAVVSRAPGDRVSATILESEIVNPNSEAPGPEGPLGVGLLVVTRNPAGDPTPDEGAVISARVIRSLIRSPAGGPGLFAFNFASLGRVSVTAQRNVIGGGMIANGGVSRPDAVHDARVRIESIHNLYRDERTDACAAPRPGWNLTGGSGPPAPFPVPGTARNSLLVRSENDRIEGFTTAVQGAGSRRFFPSPTAGASDDNRVELKMFGTRLSTLSCDGASFVADLDLAGAFAGEGAGSPGDGNALRAVLRGVRGSGGRFNQYSNVVGFSGASDNRLEIVGSPAGFARSNRRIDPAPGDEYFTGAVP
jgi:hypothetical protein